MTSRLLVDKIEGKTTSSTVQMPNGTPVQLVNMNGQGESSSNTTSSSFVEIDTDFRTTITPKFSDSKIMIFCTMGLRLYKQSGNDARCTYRLYDVTGGAAVAGTQAQVRHYDYNGGGHYGAFPIPFNVLMDSWGTTAKTFTFQLQLDAGTGTATNDDTQSTSITIMEIAQ